MHRRILITTILLLFALVSVFAGVRVYREASDGEFSPPQARTGFNAELGTFSSSGLKVDHWYRPEDARNFLLEKYGPEAEGFGCAVEGDDYVFVFETNAWSNTYDDDTIKVDKGKLTNNGSGEDFPFSIMGGGYGYFGEDVYHVCLGKGWIDPETLKELAGWAANFFLTANRVKKNLTLHRTDDPLYTPHNFSGSYNSTNDQVTLTWSLHPEHLSNTTQAVILREYNNTPLIVNVHDETWVHLWNCERTRFVRFDKR
jgi:hypothetical protein